MSAVSPWSGYLDNISKTFDTGVNNLHQDIEELLIELSKKPSDPALLAQYQSKLSEYNLYRNAQSNTVKVFKDIDAAIIQNFR
ncbi:type III secretion system needle complex protein [Yokenella regensburgei]|uniref:type III secretion system needle complex protein n=1 Tax=Yokenella regensburgei TaxID=158877 RepID=UPI0014333405|nr:type III secretion system needle complex protein [Yokenella regensburgei]QIU92567.1 type III secretion system needle complex protein [Yokenella regensburgei]